MKNTRKRKSSGFADTKRYPHKGHPANYRRISNDKIEYLTFTHTPDSVFIDNKEYYVLPLTSNISEKERKNSNNKSYVFPRRFVGKRSALGKEKSGYSLMLEDKIIVDNLFLTLPTTYVKYSNKKKK